jgi:hypothetical protein
MARKKSYIDFTPRLRDLLRIICESLDVTPAGVAYALLLEFAPGRILFRAPD